MEVSDLTLRPIRIFEVSARHHSAILPIHANIVLPPHHVGIEFSGFDRVIRHEVDENERVWAGHMYSLYLRFKIPADNRLRNHAYNRSFENS